MRLSNREIQVAELIAWGASDKEVAEELYISVLTAHTHRSNILRKLNAHNAQDITRWYFQYKHQVFFGFNPRQIRHIAWVLLILIISMEVYDMDALRVRRVRNPKPIERKEPARRPRKPERREFELELECELIND